MTFPECPLRADVKEQIYAPLPKGFPHCDWTNVQASMVGLNAVREVSEALQKQSHQGLARLFSGDVIGETTSYWKDTLALTAHLRTFRGNRTIASALLELHDLRQVSTLQFAHAQVLAASDDLKWVNCSFNFTTSSPKARCKGTLMLIPDGTGLNGHHGWKVWSMTTWLADFEDHPEDEAILRQPSEPMSDSSSLSTEVLIVGGGNSGVLLAARLKALGVSFIVVDRNKKVGDNWALRYDCMRFHTYKSFCETPYISYDTPTNDGLTRDELATQLGIFAEAFDLDRRILHAAHVTSTKYDKEGGKWVATVAEENRERVITSRCVVLATGAGFSGANVPDIPGRELFKGISIHSTQFKNAEELVQTGAKSVVIVGSANTAFDVLGDCYESGLKTTMIQRSPTYVVPMTYFAHPMSLGAYDVIPVEDADGVVNGGPLAIGGPLLALCHRLQALAEPNRYDNVRRAGFRVEDSQTGDLALTLVERCGGHFVDMGKGIELISTGQVGIRSGSVPAAYLADGLLLEDGSKVEADAIIWCTGFGSLDARKGLSGVLGEGATEIANKLESTWGVDAEGETRGLWKRQPNVENLWVFAGGTAQHRWFSKVIAQQIKGVLEGIIPEPYRRTPEDVASPSQGVREASWLSNLQ
ncbi:putative indole-3-pyruvate monooxygenase YUCCA10 [Colletotrichum orbiculare MAFF 240422]|uniref:Indole-3-pyruvate monooxygenase YUCCA10 n=1 Tax=Colletotrichum orbiculare (strain 104-T / ATCC 96160 / CBS 514.97 / LARS 414 / MAFF 240422) TaxID=1213857 RepID=A0A484F9V0_COLOR|nr:putative indole-3-pyruvate monooxygenase YUCCA10 [Colletotrichum orbiculare MAFF 240422]